MSIYNRLFITRALKEVEDKNTNVTLPLSIMVLGIATFFNGTLLAVSDTTKVSKTARTGFNIWWSGQDIS